MEREVRFSLQVWMSDPADEYIEVLAMDSSDMRYVLEIEPGYCLRMN